MVCWLLVAVSGGLALVLATAGLMSSDPCRPGEAKFICTGAGQSIAWWLPLAGWAVSTLLAGAAVTGLARRGRRRWPGLAAGLTLYAAVLATDWTLVAR